MRRVFAGLLSSGYFQGGDNREAPTIKVVVLERREALEPALQSAQLPRGEPSSILAVSPDSSPPWPFPSLHLIRIEDRRNGSNETVCRSVTEDWLGWTSSGGAEAPRGGRDLLGNLEEGLRKNRGRSSPCKPVIPVGTV
ncbi:hypothetical protein KM043_003641 [Ampulex compressa]|nr:hypothetical protein KM043_003641 [Ampulex compressa]